MVVPYKRVIQVQFIEKGADKPFANAAVPLEQLPDSFEVATKLQISGVDWQVDHAVPANKGEFKNTGTLRVYLYKAKSTMVAPSDILFSLATINDALPRLVNASLENVFVAHEDDWRQVELVSKNFNDLVWQEFAAIQDIYQNHRQGSAFKTLHVRKLIPAPLIGARILLSEVKELFGVSHEYSGAAFSSTAAIIERGFAFRVWDAATILWGQLTEEGLISVLCISGEPDSLFSQRMESLLSQHNLFYIDWHNPSG